LTPAQRARVAEAWKRAKDIGKLKGPLKLTTARLLLAAAIDR
jgi:hypothetical protein